jgi:hypothetical protein
LIVASVVVRDRGADGVPVLDLLPDLCCPAALHDVTAAYQALLEREGSGAQVVVSGESAGPMQERRCRVSGDRSPDDADPHACRP